MWDKAEIWNTALGVLGEETIIDPDNDDSRAAILIRGVYELCRDFVLEQAFWHFARTRVVLSPSTTTPAFGWSNQYALPGNFINVMPFRHIDGTIRPYAVESAALDPGQPDAYSNVLLIDSDGPLNTIYIRRVTSEAEMSATFGNALAGWLAMRIAVPLSVDAGKQQEASRFFQAMIKEGKRLDAQKAPLLPVNQDQMERIRQT